MIYFRCSRCGKRVPRGEVCSCRQREKRKYTPPEGIRKLYHTARWAKLRAAVLSKFSGLDPWAHEQKRIEFAETVHHIIPAAEDPTHFYDFANLIPLSRKSHDEVHALYRRSEESKHMTQEKLRLLAHKGAEGEGE